MEGVDRFVEVVDDDLYNVVSDNDEGIHIPVYDGVDIISSCCEGREKGRHFLRYVGDVVKERSNCSQSVGWICSFRYSALTSGPHYYQSQT